VHYFINKHTKNLIPTMTDRSNEFFAFARSIPATGAMSSIRVGGGGASAVTSTSSDGMTRPLLQQQQQQQQQQSTNPALAELRKFRNAASEISRDVSVTSALLAELSRLVKTGAGGTRMFADEGANERADALVLRIKSNIETLNLRLEEASSTLEYSKRRLGKNSQAGLEASNLVGALKEEFVKTTSGFKAVLEERSDGMKDTNDRKLRVIGGGGGLGGGRLDGHAASGGGGGFEERVDLLTLMNKPAVYGGDQRASSFGEMGVGLSGGIGGGGGGNFGMPTLDLTSSMMSMTQRHQDASGGLPAGESTSQLPRPREFTFTTFLTLNAGVRRCYSHKPAPF
jgi:hypothetical protein